MPLDYETLTPEELEQLRSSALGTEVAVGEIERELKSLWTRDDTATRASLINFAVYNEHLGTLLENTKLISEITLEHACRAILIASLPEKLEPRIRAWITAHCRLDADGKKVACSEQVSFLVESRNINLIRNIVFAHLDSDLPLVLWWQGDFSDTFEERLYSLIDRLFIDSASASDPRRFYATVIAALESGRSRFYVHDLAWTRSHPFRLSIAASFDNPALLSKLGRTESIVLRCAPGHEPAALFMVAWFATQSGWAWGGPDQGGGSFRNESAGRSVKAVIEASPEGAPLSSFRVAGEGFSVTVSQEQGARFLRQEISIEGQERVEMAPAGSDHASGLVSEQLARGGNNRLFLKILPAFRELLESFPVQAPG